jgi:hypothetical protein
MHKGSCLCGAVTFDVEGALPPPNACHCSRCRKQSGHYFASTEVARDRLRISGSDNVSWYFSSEKVRRGFCATCGASLFFDPPHRDWIAVAMGAFDGPTETRMNLHIFVDDKGDYYQIADGLPQNAQ